MRRRRFVRAGAGLAGSTWLVGCAATGLFETRRLPATPPVLENRPDAVYVPTHVEGMTMVGVARAGPYRCALSYSYPHRFWLVTGRNRQLVELRSDDTVHLMASLWDDETAVFPPNSSVSLEVTRAGEAVVEKPPWPMLSQNMGFHFGDNVALRGDGTYDVTVDVGPLGTRRSGAFQGRFEDSASASFTLEFGRGSLEGVDFRRLDDRAGEAGAVDPMRMDMLPMAQLPPEDELPGAVVGTATSGDGRFVVAVLESPPDGVDGDGPYLAVSAQTPYNRYPLPFMGLSATVGRGGTSVFDGPLTATLDPALDYHYGAAVDSLESGDAIAITPGAPPQVARHEGYETAFFEMPPMELTV